MIKAILILLVISALSVSSCSATTFRSTSIGDRNITVRLQREGNSLTIQRIENHASGYNWASVGTTVGPYIAQDNRRMDGSDNPNDFMLIDQKLKRSAGKVSEMMTEWKAPDGLSINWGAKSFPKASVVEFQTKLTNTGDSRLDGIYGLGPISFRLRGDMPLLRVYWVNRSSYRLQSVDLKDEISISGGRWNAPEAAGWVAIENPDAREVIFLGIEWESYWKLDLRREGSDIIMNCYLEGLFAESIAPHEEVTSPRVFMGVSHGNIDDSLHDLYDYLRIYVKPKPLKNFPLVTYGAWGTEGSGVEEALLSEISFAKDIGVDAFIHDASYYKGSAMNGSGDWFSGVGNWDTENRDKLPHGLAYMSAKAHAAGMKFGLWFAPHVVDSKLVGSLIPEKWVAKNDGKDVMLDLGNGWASIKQVCLGDPDVVEYLRKTMTASIEEYNLDWLKWDKSGLPGPVCNRADHGHDSKDGMFADLRGEYELYSYLHRRFPNLMLENCGYPSRLDYGLQRYITANWLSDDTTDEVRCRRSQIHGCFAVQSAYNTAFVINYGNMKTENDPQKLDTIIRSRMIGHFGMGTMNGKLNERLSLLPSAAIEALKRNIANYKKYRHLLVEDVYHILPLADKIDQWDGIQFCRRDGSESVVMLFRGASPEVDKKIKLRGLQSDTGYILTSFNTGESFHISGSELADKGLTVSLPKANTSEIYLLKTE